MAAQQGPIDWSKVDVEELKKPISDEHALWRRLYQGTQPVKASDPSDYNELTRYDHQL